LAAATPALRAALHWCAFVERVWPPTAGEIEAQELTNETPHAVIVANAKARAQLADLRLLLFPED